MRLLVLGGTVFLSRAVAAEAVARGHDVVCACRGESGSVPDGARLVPVDRTGPLPDLGPVDALVDVARTPSWVRRAVAALPDAHWTFVSTVNVYADHATPGGRPGDDLLEPEDRDLDPASSPEAYGAMKVACERAVLDGATSATIVRPGLIVGPGDPTGRFSYWPRRLSLVPQSPAVLAPGDPADVVQVIDVRDLADWLVTCAEQRTQGIYDGVGAATPISGLLAACADGLGVGPRWTWVDQSFLAEQGVEPWSGPTSVPLWLPRPEYDGMLARDVAPSLAAGLRLRPVAETARDTAAWLDAKPDAVVTGIGVDREQELLAAWSGSRHVVDGDPPRQGA